MPAPRRARPLISQTSRRPDRLLCQLAQRCTRKTRGGWCTSGVACRFSSQLWQIACNEFRRQKFETEKAGIPGKSTLGTAPSLEKNCLPVVKLKITLAGYAGLLLLSRNSGRPGAFFGHSWSQKADPVKSCTLILKHPFWNSTLHRSALTSISFRCMTTSTTPTSAFAPAVSEPKHG